MNKIDLKLIIWGIISALAVFSAFASASFSAFLLFITIAVFSMFIVFIASHPAVRVFAGIISMAGAYFAAGAGGCASCVLFVIVPALVMVFSIKSTKDFAVTLCSGTFAACIGVIIYDRFVIPSNSGGIRVIFSSAVDAVSESWLLLIKQLSEQSGVDLSSTADMLSGYFYSIKLMLPALVIIAALFVMYLVLLASRRFIINIPIPPFFALRASKTIAYAYCIGYIFSMFVTSDMSFVFSNAVAVLSVVLTVCGISLLRFFTKLIQSKVLSVIVFIFAVVVCSYIPFVFITAGTVDAIIDFRRRRK